MEFSRTENDNIYLEGTEKERSQILALVQDFIDTDGVDNYTGYTAEQAAQINIQNDKEILVVSKSDLIIILEIFDMLEELDYPTERVNVSVDEFTELYNGLTETRSKTFSVPADLENFLSEK